MSDQLVLDGVEPPPVAPDFALLRKERGWSVEEVADKLKISVAKVRAIEKLDFDLLPDGPYTRGFVRNYARLLSVDPSPWLNLMDARQQRAPTRLVRDDPRRLPKFDDTGKGPLGGARMLWWGVGLVVLAMLAFLAWWERASWMPALQQALPMQQSIQTPVAQPTFSAPAAVAVPAPTPDQPLPPITAPAPAAPVQPAMEVPAGHKALRMTFNADAWVEVKDASGKVLLSQLNKSGSQASLTGQPPMRFTVGAARDVVLLVDGQSFDMVPHVRNDVARFVVEK
jgi:cytoskeleton protein RodZ